MRSAAFEVTFSLLSSSKTTRKTPLFTKTLAVKSRYEVTSSLKREFVYDTEEKNSLGCSAAFGRLDFWNGAKLLLPDFTPMSQYSGR